MKKLIIAMLLVMLAFSSLAAAYGNYGGRRYESYERTYDYTLTTTDTGASATTVSYNNYPWNNGYYYSHPEQENYYDATADSWHITRTEKITDAIKFDTYYADYASEPYIGWRTPAYYYGGYGYGRPHSYKQYDMYGNFRR